MIATRFGQEAARVYALVLDADALGSRALRVGGTDPSSNDTAIYLGYSRFWNDQEVSDLALVSPQVARALLEELAQAGFLRSHLADVVNAVPPGLAAPAAKHCWVFGAREEDTNDTLTKSFFQYLCNVMERKAVEVEKLQKLALQ